MYIYIYICILYRRRRTEYRSTPLKGSRSTGVQEYGEQSDVGKREMEYRNVTTKLQTRRR